MIHRGTVTRLGAAGAHITIPRLAGKLDLGPATVPDGLELAVGDKVLVAALDDNDDLVVLLRL